MRRDLFQQPSCFILGLATLSLVLGLASTSQASSHPYFVTLVNTSRGTPECLVFGENGHARHPERFNWGPGDHCGFADANGLLDNRQAVWRVVPLGGGEVMLQNASRGHYECLIFGGNGHEAYPQRFNWGQGAYCGFPGGLGPFLENRQAVWTLEPLGGDAFALLNASRDSTGECLRFGGEGTFIKPERLDWGPWQYCGNLGGRLGLLEDETAVWHLEEVRFDHHPVPDSWLNGYILLQNVMHSNQVLHVGHDGNGQLFAQWGEDAAHRWEVQLTGDGHFFNLRNALHPHQRLHVGHDGNGQVYAGDGDPNDDAYKWTVEPKDGAYFLRNKLYPDQQLHVGHDGNGQLYTGWSQDEAFQWRVTVVPTVDAPAHLTYTHYSGPYDLIFQNKMHPHQRLHVGHDGNGELYAEDGDTMDFTYRFTSGDAGNGEIYLTNNLHLHQRLNIGRGGDGRPFAGSNPNIDGYRFKMEPTSGNFFFLTNTTYGQRLHVGHDGNGRLYAANSEYGDDDSAYMWRVIYSYIPPFEEQHRTCDDGRFLTCFYEGQYQTGKSYCSAGNDGNVPQGVRQRARSVRGRKCASNVDGEKPSRLFLYNEHAQKGDTQVVNGAGEILGNLFRDVASFDTVEEDEHYFCFYWDDHYEGRESCFPFEPSRFLTVAPVWNDKISSVKAFPSWECGVLEVCEDYDGGTCRSIKSNEEKLSVLSWGDRISSFEIIKQLSSCQQT